MTWVVSSRSHRTKLRPHCPHRENNYKDLFPTGMQEEEQNHPTFHIKQKHRREDLSNEIWNRRSRVVSIINFSRAGIAIFITLLYILWPQSWPLLWAPLGSTVDWSSSCHLSTPIMVARVRPHFLHAAPSQWLSMVRVLFPHKSFMTGLLWGARFAQRLSISPAWAFSEVGSSYPAIFSPLPSFTDVRPVLEATGPS